MTEGRESNQAPPVLDDNVDIDELYKLVRELKSAGDGCPELAVTVRERWANSTFVAPNPWLFAVGRVAGERTGVARVSFGVSPLGDRVYVASLDVDERHRRQGIAGALLATISRFAGGGERMLPITPMHETFDAHAFWDSLRRGRVPGLVVTADVRMSETTSSQWSHETAPKVDQEPCATADGGFFNMLKHKLAAFRWLR